MTMRSPSHHLLENAASFLVGARHLSSSDDRHSREILLHHLITSPARSSYRSKPSCSFGDGAAINADSKFDTI